MPPVIDYYVGPLSPWSYLGHARFAAIAAHAGAEVRLRAVDVGAVFAVSGGLPLGQRPPQRQAYRLRELARFSEALGVPLNLQPRHFPVDPHRAARLLNAVVLHDGDAAAMRLCGAVFAAVWAQERDISDAGVLAALLAECGLPAQRNEQAMGAEAAALYEANTQRAIRAQVFGMPSYVVDGEIFWGQDRLEFLARAL